MRLAVVHAQVFEDHAFRQEALKPITDGLESDPRLDLPGRRFQLSFYPGLLAKALSRNRELFRDAVARWAVETLPGLAAGRHRVFQIPVPLPPARPGGSVYTSRWRSGGATCGRYRPPG